MVLAKAPNDAGQKIHAAGGVGTENQFAFVSIAKFGDAALGFVLGMEDGNSRSEGEARRPG